MQVLLLQAVPSLGNPGELVSVKGGYARNYLVPQGKAIVATPKNVKQFEHQKKIAQSRREKFLKDLAAVASKVNNTKLSFEANVGPQGKLFGSITSKMIADSLSAEVEYTVDRNRIGLEQPIREVGEYVLEVRLDNEVISRVKVSVTGNVIETAEETAAEEAADEAETDSADTEAEEGAETEAAEEAADEAGE